MKLAALIGVDIAFFLLGVAISRVVREVLAFLRTARKYIHLKTIAEFDRD